MTRQLSIYKYLFYDYLFYDYFKNDTNSKFLKAPCAN